MLVIYNKKKKSDRLVETSGDCEWTDNIEYTRQRTKTNNTDT